MISKKPLTELYELWKQFGDVPVNENGRLEAQFLEFEPGDKRENVWRWFEQQNDRFIVGEVMQGIRHLDAELKSFDLIDDQMKWVEEVRKSYPSVSPKEAFRLAEDEYISCNGVFPESDAPPAPEPKQSRKPRP